MINRIQLEPEAQAFAEAEALSPFLFALGPEQGRLALDEAQSGRVRKHPVDMEDLTITDGLSVQLALRILRPQNARTPLPVIMYIHGAGWVFGSMQTHDRLMRELAVGAGAAVVFPVYRLCPVTDAASDTTSYHQFAEGYHLRRDAMMWFWEQYTRHPGERNEITASPLRAGGAQLQGLPAALIITAEADVLRDEGEAYANKLREAGVRVTAVRFQGTIHDFVMLNPLATSAAARGAIALATAWLRERFAARLACALSWTN